MGSGVFRSSILRARQWPRHGQQWPIAIPWPWSGRPPVWQKGYCYHHLHRDCHVFLIDIDTTIELAKALTCTFCICVGGGYSRSTYDGYGAGSIDGGGKVVDDGISLHRTMVWLWFFFVVGAKSTSSFPDLQGRGNMVLNETTKSGHSCSARHSRTILHVWGRLCRPPVLAAAGVMGAERTIIH